MTYGGDADVTRMTEGEHSLDVAFNRRIVRNSAWVGVGFGGSRLLAFVSTLVLVRLLEPEAFGIVAVGMALLAVITQLQASGLGAALVHTRRHEPRIAASSVFVFAASAGVALTLATVLLAPLYTRLLRVPESTEYVQVLALLLGIRGLAVAPAAILERSLDFRSGAMAELAGGIASVIVAISCAVIGLGAWSLVAGQVTASSAQTIVIWARTHWRPSLTGVSRTVLLDLLRYGRFVSGTNVVVIVNNTLDSLVVARFLGVKPLGEYHVAWRLAEIPNTFIGTIIGRVMFSVYSSLQHDLDAVRAAYLQNMQRTVLFALPATVTFGLAAEPIVRGVLGPSWEGTIDPLRLLALFSFVRLLGAPSGELFKGVGRPQLMLLITILFAVVTLPLLLILVPRLGTSGAALAMVIGVTIAGTVTLGLTLRLLAVRPATFAGVLMRPVACASSVALAILAALPIAETLNPAAALALVVAAAMAAFVVSATLVARPLLIPIWSAFRRN